MENYDDRDDELELTVVTDQDEETAVFSRTKPSAALVPDD